jgi:dCMP deaminase
MKMRLIMAHLDAARTYAKLSYSKRIQVGCLIVRETQVISIGINGMPSRWSNCCEDEDGHSLPEVLHAEANAIAKLARWSGNGDGAIMISTHSPCMECAKLIHQAGIVAVYYGTEYRLSDGLTFLHRMNIPAHLVVAL